MTKKVIAVDLDGTLLDSNSNLSDFTKETIKKISIDFKFAFKYLSGANVDKGTIVNFDYSVVEKDTQSKQYKNYVFSNPSNYRYQFRNFAETTLNDGSEEVNLKLEP